METTFDVRIYKTDKYEGKTTTTYWVQWAVAGKRFKEPYKTSALAESFRSDLMSAARKGEAFAVDTGLPVSMNRPDTVTWFAFACDYAEMKWKTLAGNSRRSTARALTDITLAMLSTDRGKPTDDELRAACGWAFNIRRKTEGTHSLRSPRRSNGCATTRGRCPTSLNPTPCAT
jgi:hypothetical protein